MRPSGHRPHRQTSWWELTINQDSHTILLRSRHFLARYHSVPVETAVHISTVASLSATDQRGILIPTGTAVLTYTFTRGLPRSIRNALDSLHTEEILYS